VTTIADVAAFLEELAPQALAEEWDNVGLLLGSESKSVTHVMTSLTLTPDVAREALTKGAGLVVTHHPILFRPVQRITDATAEGAMLLELAAAGVAVYSPHTGYDSASDGINRQLADTLGLTNVTALRPQCESDEPDGPGAGRVGDLATPATLGELIASVKSALHIEHLQYVGRLEQRVERVGIACGAAAGFLADAHSAGCQVFLTGEARFHDCLRAREFDVAMLLTGHFGSERPAVENLAAFIAARFSELTVWASEVETDPLQWA
jgi:dinuclear metal center YbgI/SA1388 family protein